VPYVDNSIKWAGGGLLANVIDLLKYGNQMLLFYQNENSENKLFLKSSTMKSLVWTAQSNPTEKLSSEVVKALGEPNAKLSYGMGWYLCMNENSKLNYVYHTGGGVGAVSCLLIVPNEASSNEKHTSHPQGLVVSVLCNSQNTNEIVKFARQISNIFSVS
jgi:serine beta-lactamase-like protein LACTB